MLLNLFERLASEPLCWNYLLWVSSARGRGVCLRKMLYVNVRDVSLPEGEKWKFWKSAWIWAKSPQNGLIIDKSAGIWTSWKQEFLQKQENLHPRDVPALPGGCRNFDFRYAYFCFHLPPINVLISYRKKHTNKQRAQIDNLLKIHPIYVNWVPLPVMKSFRSLNQTSHNMQCETLHLCIHCLYGICVLLPSENCFTYCFQKNF